MKVDFANDGYGFVYYNIVSTRISRMFYHNISVVQSSGLTKEIKLN